MSSPVALFSRQPRRPTLGILGVGAFGGFAVQHLAPHFHILGFDPLADLRPLEAQYGLCPATLCEVASCDFVVLSMPVQMIGKVVRDIRPYLREGCVVLDVCSIKSGPAAILSELPSYVHVVGTHPLFGPQSGKAGIAGLQIVVVPIRGSAWRSVVAFLRMRLNLKVDVTTAEDHDRQMAHVQGLTHLISRVLLSISSPPLSLTTTAFDHLKSMVELLCRDSDDLFHAICADNPYVNDVIQKFLDTTKTVGQRFCVNTRDEAHPITGNLSPTPEGVCSK